MGMLALMTIAGVGAFTLPTTATGTAWSLSCSTQCNDCEE